jgi:WD40 repeat protein
VFDLRKDHNNPVYEREKSQDVFSLTSTGSHIFYGCRNHNVYPFCLSTFTTLANLQPPHFDVVTSLAMMNNGSTLVSGSRDKNLRLYNLSNPAFPESSNVLTAHNDHINVLETDESQ